MTNKLVHYGLLLFRRIAKGSIAQEKRLVARLHMHKTDVGILSLEAVDSFGV